MEPFDPLKNPQLLSTVELESTGQGTGNGIKDTTVLLTGR
jgi:hypothetical protein